MPAMAMQQMEENMPKDGLRLDNLLTQKILFLSGFLCKVAHSNMFHLEPHPSFYRWLMKGIFDAYVL